MTKRERLHPGEARRNNVGDIRGRTGLPQALTASRPDTERVILQRLNGQLNKRDMLAQYQCRRDIAGGLRMEHSGDFRFKRLQICLADAQDSQKRALDSRGCGCGKTTGAGLAMPGKPRGCSRLLCVTRICARVDFVRELARRCGFKSARHAHTPTYSTPAST